MFPTSLRLHTPAGIGIRPGLNGQSRRLISIKTYRSGGDPNERGNRDALLDNVETTSAAAEPSSSSEASAQEDRVTRLRRRREERRRMREQALSGTTSGAQGWDSASPPGAPSPSTSAAAWQDSEWGPGEAIPPDYNQYGWAEESWTDNGIANNYRGGRRPSSSPPTSSYNRNGKGAAAATSNVNNNFNNGDSDAAWNDELRQRRERRRRSGSPSYQDDDYLEEEDEEEVERGGGRQYANTRAKEYVPGSAEPDIALLSPQELERVLPVVPFSAQATYFNGGAAQAVQRWGASLALTVLLSKVAVLAASTLTWPLWWPWAQAASKNYSLRKQSGYAGLWRTQIIEVETRGRPRPQFFGGGDGNGSGSDEERSRSSASGGSRFSTMRTTRIVLGDPEGAQTEFVLPQDARYDLIQTGQPAELVVLSDSPNFESFKAVKDVYLPECGLWLSEYPYLDRTEFLELSLEVEREAMMSGRSGSGFDSNGGTDDVDGENEYEEEDDGYYYNNYSNGRPSPPPRY